MRCTSTPPVSTRRNSARHLLSDKARARDKPHPRPTGVARSGAFAPIGLITPKLARQPREGTRENSARHRRWRTTRRWNNSARRISTDRPDQRSVAALPANQPPRVAPRRATSRRWRAHNKSFAISGDNDRRIAIKLKARIRTLGIRRRGPASGRHAPTSSDQANVEPSAPSEPTPSCGVPARTTMLGACHVRDCVGVAEYWVCELPRGEVLRSSCAKPEMSPNPVSRCGPRGLVSVMTAVCSMPSTQGRQCVAGPYRRPDRAGVQRRASAIDDVIRSNGSIASAAIRSQNQAFNEKRRGAHRARRSRSPNARHHRCCAKAYRPDASGSWWRPPARPGAGRTERRKPPCPCLGGVISVQPLSVSSRQTAPSVTPLGPTPRENAVEHPRVDSPARAQTSPGRPQSGARRTALSLNSASAPDRRRRKIAGWPARAPLAGSMTTKLARVVPSCGTTPAVRKG